MGMRQIKGGYSPYYRDPITGKQVTVPGGPWKKKTDAIDALREVQRSIRQQSYTDPTLGKRTMKVWSEMWMASRAVDVNTLRKAQTHLDAHILPRFGSAAVALVQPIDIRTWIVDMGKAGAKPSYVKSVYSTLRSMMGAAVEAGLRPANPCDAVKARDLPRPGVSTAVFLEPGQVDLLVALAPESYQPVILVASRTGLRWGELTALRWADVELDNGLLHVRRAYQRGNPEPVLPKNNKPRTLELDDVTVETLKALPIRGELVFPSRTGGPLNYSHARKVFFGLTRRCFLHPEPSYHDLRHSHCSQLIMDGADVISVSQRMGHHSPAFTLERYGHLRPNSGDHMREILAKR